MDSVRCYGPPGTGKTTRGIRWVRHCVQQGADVLGLAYVSYTNAACDEARERLCAALAEDGHQLWDAELQYCATLHALARRALGITHRGWLADEHLKEFAAEKSYDLVASRRRRDVGEDLEALAASGGVDAPLLEIWNWGRNRLLRQPDQVWDQFSDYDPGAVQRLDYRRFCALVADYEGWKDSSFLRDYTDLLEEIVANPVALPVDCAVVDEAQDLSPLLWAAADVLLSEARYRATCGDDDQAIYTFQGAAPELLNSRLSDRTVLLEQSYRLPAVIEARARQIIGRNRNRMAKTVLPHPDRTGEIHRTGSLAELDFSPERGTWFVLVRNWSFSSDLAGDLESLGIPYRFQGGTQYSPWDPKGPLQAARTVLALSEPGGVVGPSTLAKFVENTRSAGKFEVGAWQYGAKAALQRRLEDADAGIGSSAKYSLLDLVDLGLTEWAFDRILARDFSVIANCSDRNLDAYSKALRSGHFDAEPWVTISSIHGVKGLEADNVLALAACTRAPAANLLRADRAEEEHRLAYVAITRSRNRFYVLDGNAAGRGEPYEVW